MTPSEHARRGRPKGSGLDDRAQLEAIARLLESDPNLKPTTAIKLIGVTDPSAIRRLRDKLKGGAAADTVVASRPPVSAPAPQPEVTAAEPERAPPAVTSAPTVIVVEAVRLEPLAVEAPQTAPVMALAIAEPVADALPAVETVTAPPALADTAAASNSDAVQPPLPLFTQLCALGLQTLTSTVEAQMAVVEGMLKSPPVASVLKQQVLLNEVAKAFCAPSTDVRTNSK